MEDFLRQWLFDPTVGKLIASAVGLLVVYGIVRVAQRRVTPRLVDLDTRYRVRKIITFLGYIAYAVVLVTVFSERLGALGVTLGVAGAGVAFALQEVIVSVAGWVSITVGRTFKIGDRVQLGGIMGDVIDIGVLRSTLMECGGWVQGDLYSGRIVKVGNSYVFKEPVTNYTADFPFLWDEIVVPVKHGSDPDLAQQILEAAANDLVGDYAQQAAKSWKQVVKLYRIEDARVTPMVTMNANENWMIFTARYVVDYRQRRSTKDRLWRRILGDFEGSGGQVVLACSSLFVETAPVHVQLANSERH